MDFYGSGLGDRLIDESLFPSEIKEFLRGEDLLLEQCISSFDSLIEVGCMRGRYLQWAIDRVRNYFGIDIVSSYIEMGRERLGGICTGSLKCDFVLGDAEDIDILLDWKALGADPQKVLLFFPFNSFGNMQDFLPVIRSIKKSGARFFISTYSTIPGATLCRQRYYEACSYLELEKVEDNRGVTFISRDGLRTIAYHPDFLVEAFKKEGMLVDVISFADIGIAYSSPNVFIVKS